MKIQLKRSNVLTGGFAKEPLASQLEYGELAINYNTDDPAIFLKDSNNNIIRISGVGNIADDGQVELPASTTPPLNPLPGNLWYNSDDGRLYIYYADADTEQWVDASPDSWDPSVIPDTSDNTSQPSTLDDRYLMLNAANDPVTGGLNITGGNVGIGTTSPSYLLDVNANNVRFGDSSGVGLLQLGASSTESNNFHVGAASGSTLRLWNGDIGSGTELLRVTSDGSVGIGTTNPGALFDVVKNGTAGDITSFRQFRVGHTVNQGYSGYIGYGQPLAGQKLGLIIESYDNGNASPTYINPNGGNVGIGTTIADAKLKIQAGNSDTPATALAIRQNNAADTAQTTFSVEASPNDGVSRLISSATSNPQLALYTGGSEALRIDEDGNVGIGTTNPFAKLEIFAQGNEAEVLRLSTERPWSFYQVATGASSRLDLRSNSNKLFTVSGTRNGDLTPTETLCVSTASGRVGIGTISPVCALDVFGGANTTFTNNPFINRLYTTNDSDQNIGGGISFGGKWNGSNNQYADFGFISGVKENATAGSYAGALTFGTRTGGSGPGNYERMRITSTGNVGVGTDNPIAKFCVSEAGGNQYVRIGGTQALMLGGSASGGGIYFGSTLANPTGGIEASWDTGNNNPSVMVGVTRDGAGGTGGGAKPKTVWAYSNTIRSYINNQNIFEINTSGLTVLNGLGISLGGNSTRLDDYEAGSWTPTINTGITNAVLSVATGNYTKIGNLVTINFEIRASSGTPNSLDFVIGGLPFTSGVASGNYGSINISYNNILTGFTELRAAHVTTNNTTIRFYDGTANIVGTDMGLIWASNRRLICHGSYFAV